MLLVTFLASVYKNSILQQTGIFGMSSLLLIIIIIHVRAYKLQ